MINMNNSSRNYTIEGGASMKLAHPLIVQCNNCARQLEIYADMECVCSEERSMGEELTYESIIDDVCPNCGNSIRIHLTVWEYPICSVNYQEEKCVVRDFENNYFHINKLGLRLYSDNYRYVGDFKDGYACAMLADGS